MLLKDIRVGTVINFEEDVLYVHNYHTHFLGVRKVKAEVIKITPKCFKLKVLDCEGKLAIEIRDRVIRRTKEKVMRGLK